MPVEIKPDATSTPNYTVKVKGRRGIRDGDSSIESPITSSGFKLKSSSARPNLQSGNDERYTYSDGEYSSKQSIRDMNRSRSHSHEHLSNSEDENLGNSYDNEDKSRKNIASNSANESSSRSSWLLNTSFLLFFVIMAFGAGLYFTDSGEPEPQLHNNPKSFNDKLNDLKKKFSNQGDDFWITINVSIREISVLNQPRTVLLVYKKSAQKTVDQIITSVSKLAVCEITDCSKKPLIISGSSLNKSEILKDYGKIISKYRDELRENGVMVIKNLEKVPGIAAQAFHSFCDDYNPVVKHALILFTLHIDEFSDKSKMRNVEQYLLKLWNDIPVDNKFYPLFTRISSTILTVKPES